MPKGTLDAHQVNRRQIQTGRAYRLEDVFPLVVPAQGSAALGPTGFLIPKNDDAVEPSVQEGTGHRGTFLQQARLVVQGNNLLLKSHGEFLPQQIAEAAAEVDLKAIGTAFDDDADAGPASGSGHRAPRVSRPSV